MNAPRTRLHPSSGPWYRTAPVGVVHVFPGPAPPAPSSPSARRSSRRRRSPPAPGCGTGRRIRTPTPTASPSGSRARPNAPTTRPRCPAGPRWGPPGWRRAPCSHRGLRSLAHIDRGRRDVRSFGLDWRVTAVPEDVARSGPHRMRARLEREGRTLVDTRVDRPGFRFRTRTTRTSCTRTGTGRRERTPSAPTRTAGSSPTASRSTRGRRPAGPRRRSPTAGHTTRSPLRHTALTSGTPGR